MSTEKNKNKKWKPIHLIHSLLQNIFLLGSIKHLKSLVTSLCTLQANYPFSGCALAPAGAFPSTLIDLGGRASRPCCSTEPQTDAQEVLSPVCSCLQLSISSDLTGKGTADLHAHLFLGHLLAFFLEIHLAWHLARENSFLCLTGTAMLWYRAELTVFEVND